MESVRQQLRTFVIDNFLYGRRTQLRDEDSFLDMGIIDSTGLLELVNFIEKQYRVHVEEADLTPENLDSIARLTQFLERKQGNQTAVLSQEVQSQPA